MIGFSSNVQRILQSATVQVADYASDLRRQGHSIISLAAGEPHFKTPDHISAAAITAIQCGQTKYTQSDGLHELRDAISKHYPQNLDQYGYENVLISTGAKQIIFNAMIATLEPSDEVILLAPYWISYKDIVEFCGSQVNVVPWKSNKNFFPDLDALRNALTPKTKWLILNSPNNPSGAVYDRETLLGIAKILYDHPNIWILSDEIYDTISLSNKPNLTFSKVAKDLAERTLLVNGFSKNFCMTGWRVGFGIGNKQLIKEMSKVQSQSTTNACTISQHAALAAINGERNFIGHHNESYKYLRDIATSILSGCGGISLSNPEGAFYLLINVDEILCRISTHDEISDDVSLSRRMLETAGVAVVPGTPFGAPGFVRISFACEEDYLREGCKRIVQALSIL